MSRIFFFVKGSSVQANMIQISFLACLIAFFALSAKLLDIFTGYCHLFPRVEVRFTLVHFVEH